jgi:serine/threonine-protein kinase HipA
MTRSLTVWWEGAVVGSLTAGRHGAMRFTYDGNWLANPDAPALSVSLPKRTGPFPPRQCRPFFEGLLPEGAQRDAAASALGVSRANEFKLLERLGGDVAGALSLYPDGETPPRFETQGPAIALTDDELASLLPSLETRPFLAGTRGLRLSLAGAQSKLPVVLVEGQIGLPAPGQPTTHILKPPIARFPATTENEAFAMRLAAGLGLETAPVEPYGAGGRACLLVTRYDRRAEPDGTVRRLHQEDFCQALGIVADRKYAADGGPGFRQCFELVRRACSRPAVEVLKLLDAAIVQVLLGNADAHGKNYSLLHREGRVELAPLYDLLSTVAWPDLSPNFAMRVARRATLEEMRRGDWNRFAGSAGLGAPFVRRRVRELADLTLRQAEAVGETLAGPGLDRDALERCAERVIERARRLALTV